MGRPAAFREPDVLTHAMMVFWQHGYTGTGVRDLEKATGLTASSLYNRFGSKQILFLAALDHYINKVVEHRIARYLRSDDPVTGLTRFFETTWDYIDDRRAPMACLLSNSALEFAGDRGPVQRHIRAGLSRLEDAFTDCLERACDRCTDCRQQHPLLGTTPAAVPAGITGRKHGGRRPPVPGAAYPQPAGRPALGKRLMDQDTGDN